MTVAPPFMQSFWILNFTIAAMPARLPARISRLGRLLPIGRIMISATIHMPVITRNMRSFRLILWSKIVSIHFLTPGFPPVFIVMWQCMRRLRHIGKEVRDDAAGYTLRPLFFRLPPVLWPVPKAARRQ